jgi:phosphate starvation-inducible PhoH-like protein
MPMPTSAELFFGLKLSDEQKEYADSIFDHTLTITDSISGSGKTTIAVGCAKIMQRPLYYVFFPVQEDALGFLPGDLEDKTAPYLVPLCDALTEIKEIPEKAIFSKKEFRPHAWVHAIPHTFLRGTNIKNATIIIDESQNGTKHQLKKILTRCHDSNKVILIGHSGQKDIPEHLSGFSSYIEHAKGQHFANQVNLTKDFRGNLARWADKL